MSQDFNNAPTEPDATAPLPGALPATPQPPLLPHPPLAPTASWDPNATRAAGAYPAPGQVTGGTIPYQGPIYPAQQAQPTSPDLTSAAPFAPSAQPQATAGASYADPYAPTIAQPPAIYQPPTAAPLAPRPSPRRSAPKPSAPTPQRIARPRTVGPARDILTRWLLPVPHVMLAVGFILLLAGLNLPWGSASGGTLLYPQSFQLPWLQVHSGMAEQVGQNLVTAVGLLSLSLAAMNYMLTGLNRLVKPLGMAGCGTVLLMPLMFGLMLMLIAALVGALVFGSFDPLAGTMPAPWQQNFSLANAHASLGYYTWYTGVILNFAGTLTQPFVRR